MTMGKLKDVSAEMIQGRYLNLPLLVQRYIDNTWTPWFFI